MKPLPPISLILGGTRSGKSLFAETMVLESGLQPIYLATCAAHDPEMESRIKNHQARRDENWITLEEEIDLTGCLEQSAIRGRAVLVDCLTLWTSNLMGSGRNIELEFNRLIDALPHLGSPVIFVSGEVGLGIIPDNAAARAFADHLGQLNQKLAQIAGYVVLMSAGLPLQLKSITQE